MPSKAFKCKQFTLLQDGCAMKLGIDSMLLGAWADCSNASRILDIGTGTGILVLMVAQRSRPNAVIDAVEIEAGAVKTARINVKNSPWRHRINIHHIALQQFEPPNGKYDLIITNPPYFSNALKAPDYARRLARHTDTLTFDELLKSAKRLLAKTGKLCVVLPIPEADKFTELAKAYQLDCSKVLRIQPNPNKGVNRSLLTFQFNFNAEPQCQTLVLRYGTERDAQYTEAYKSLTREFYLNF